MNFCASYINSDMDLGGSLHSWKRKSPFAEAYVERRKGHILVRLIDLNYLLVEALYVRPQRFSFSLPNIEEVVC